MRFLAGLAVTSILWSATPVSERPATGRLAAEQLAKSAERAERGGQIVEAYLLYAKAAAADPRNPAWWTKALALRIPAANISEKKLPALGETATPPQLDPSLVGSLTREQLADIERMVEPPRLKPFIGLKSFHLRGDPKSLFEQVAAEFGYTVIFDKDFSSQQAQRFDITNAGYKGALHALESATNSFIVVLSEKAMLVAPDTAQKRQDLEPNEALAIPISQRTSVQEAQELVLMVQQALEIRRTAMDPLKRLVYMRDRASKIELARALFNQLSAGKSQISAEIEFVSVGNTSSLSFGLRLPTKFPIVNFGTFSNAVSAITAGLNPGNLALGIADGALFATATRSDATTLLKSLVTASDGQAVTFHVGDKYPIQTGAYLGFGGVGGGSNGGTTYAVISTASYADITTSAISTTGKMTLVVNGQEIPFTLPEGANNFYSVMNIINQFGASAGIGAQTIQRGTKERPFSLLVVASTLGINSIQLYDDPDGAKIPLLKAPDIASSITTSSYVDATNAAVSTRGSLNLTVGKTTTPLILNEATNNLNGLRDAINAAGAGVTAAVLTTLQGSKPFYLQVVATTAASGAIQLYDDPDNANTKLLSATNEVDAFGSSFGQTVNGVSTSGFGQTYSPPPTFNFEDLGLLLKITPFVHDLDEVTLEIEAEFKVLGNGSYNGVPVISARKYQGKVRLRTSEYAVIAGLVTESEARSVSGLAGLSSIPLLGPLVRENTHSKESGQVLLVIKPTVTSLPASEFEVKTFWFGSETKPLTIL